MECGHHQTRVIYQQLSPSEGRKLKVIVGKRVCVECEAVL